MVEGGVEVSVQRTLRLTRDVSGQLQIQYSLNRRLGQLQSQSEHSGSRLCSAPLGN
jgi:hypothetical protein